MPLSPYLNGTVRREQPRTEGHTKRRPLWGIFVEGNPNKRALSCTDFLGAILCRSGVEVF